MDLSSVYGSTIWDLIRLREFRNGRLKAALDARGQEILPLGSGHRGVCQSKEQWPCFDSGDDRVQQHPGMTTMHVLWIRRHNQHAAALQAVNPFWDDETIFQEARRLSIAEYQMMAYGEYLPIIFGPLLSQYYNLNTLSSGYTSYEPFTDPTKLNDYAAAACRFGHSQVRGLFSVLNSAGQFGEFDTSRTYMLRDWWGDTELTHTGYVSIKITRFSCQLFKMCI